MGPQAYITVAKALSSALAVALFSNIVSVTIREIQKAIINNDLEMARAMLNDLAFRHKKSFDEFVNKYSDDLPDEFMKEFVK